MTSGSCISRNASMSPAFHASIPRRTASTFSCDIARSVSRSGRDLAEQELCNGQNAATGLLRQPGGFEGFGTVPKALDADPLGSQKGQEGEVPALCRNAARTPTAALMHVNNPALPRR